MSRSLPSRPPEGAVGRFWKKVVKAPDDGCWIFTGAISNPDGYGRVNFTVDGQQFTVSAHRFALWISGVDITDSEMVGEHRCNEPLCVRVGGKHLIASTTATNVWYASAAGRLRGPRPGHDSGERGRYQRSVDVREAVRLGWDEQAYVDAARPVENPLDQPTLF
ncbi:HNH endonuclease [Corynebacterium sp. AOP40-9SA-29]|uniref:HNH endonuclease n=1 Tax=Corynebacterium sp. AOP40-9SA-29 TaxID=3457677 RepID=UPI004034300A